MVQLFASLLSALFSSLAHLLPNAVACLVCLTCDGRLAMTHLDGLETHVLVNFVSNPQINTGPGAKNRLGVIANESSYQIYVNGQLLVEAGDAAQVDEMRFGYCVRATREEAFTVRFDDLEIWLIKEE